MYTTLGLYCFINPLEFGTNLFSGHLWYWALTYRHSQIALGLVAVIVYNVVVVVVVASSVTLLKPYVISTYMFVFDSQSKNVF